MCDEFIHPGLVHDPAVSRRSFGKALAAVAALSAVPVYADTGVVEKDAEVKTADGVADAALFYPEGKGTWPAVLVWTDILGLRPVFREMGHRLAAQGYVVLVPNPYYRARKAPVVEGSFDFSNPESRATIMPLAQALSPKTHITDAKAFTAYLDSLPQTNKHAKMGVQGYCMGGPIAFRTAAVAPARIGAVATFHGASLVTDKPESPHLLISKTRARYLVCIADNDDQKQPDAKDALKEAFKKAHLHAKVEVFAGAKHGWTVRGSAVYNQPAAEKAWAELLQLYKKALV